MKGKDKEADRRRGGKTISKSGQEWTLQAQLEQLKTGQDGKGLLRIYLWCPDDLPRLWDRIELKPMAQEISHFSEYFLYLRPPVTLKLGQGHQNLISSLVCHIDIWIPN